jgi:hypothetical protein
MARPFLLFGVKRPELQSDFRAKNHKPLIWLEKPRMDGVIAFVAEHK